MKISKPFLEDSIGVAVFSAAIGIAIAICAALIVSDARAQSTAYRLTTLRAASGALTTGETVAAVDLAAGGDVVVILDITKDHKEKGIHPSSS